MHARAACAARCGRRATPSTTAARAAWIPAVLSAMSASCTPTILAMIVRASHPCRIPFLLNCSRFLFLALVLLRPVHGNAQSERSHGRMVSHARADWMFSSGGGCCDCGDVEAWRESGFCSRHPGPPSTSLEKHMCDDMATDERHVKDGLLDALCAAYLHANVLEAGDEETLKAVSNGVDPRRALLQWLTSLAGTSPQTRSLVGLRLATPRTTASPHAESTGGDGDGGGGGSGGSGGGGGGGGGGGADEADSPVVLHDGNLVARSTRIQHLVGGEEGESVLDVLLRLEGKLCLAVREDVHALYFELMRDMPFKKALLCHVIRHYPQHIQAATSHALENPNARESPRDSASVSATLPDSSTPRDQTRDQTPSKGLLISRCSLSKSALRAHALPPTAHTAHTAHIAHTARSRLLLDRAHRHPDGHRRRLASSRCSSRAT